MKSILLHDQTKLSELANALGDRATEVNKAIEAGNEVIKRYNLASAALHDFLDELATRAEEYREGRSQRWQQSEAGSAYEDWWNSLIEAANAIVEIDLIGEREELFDSDAWLPPDNSPTG